MEYVSRQATPPNDADRVTGSRVWVDHGVIHCAATIIGPGPGPGTVWVEPDSLEGERFLTDTSWLSVWEPCDCMECTDDD